MDEHKIKKLRQILREVLDLPPEENIDDLRKMHCRKWDSLAQMTIISALESEFKLSIKISDIDRLNSFGSIKLFIEEHGV
jgi:acyl carrier protein